MKNFPLVESRELMAVRVISASWAKKPLIPTFETWCTSSSWKIFFLPIGASWWLLDSLLPPESKNVWFEVLTHTLRRVHEKFSSRRIEGAEAVRVISASWAKKPLIPTFETWCTSSSWKIFFPPIRAIYWLLDSFWPLEPKNVRFLLSEHSVRRVHEKFSSRQFEGSIGFWTHFGLLSPKTLDYYFLNMVCVGFMKNFLLVNSSDLLAFGLISASWAHKTLDSYFLDMMYVESMKNFLLADSSELMAVRLSSATWAQNR